MRIALAALPVLFATAQAFAADADHVVKPTALSVADAVIRIEAAIEKAPPTLIAKVDHGAGAAAAGMELGDMVLLVLGAPKVGTPILQANPLAGLDLPAKILVYSEGGQTKIAYLKPTALADRHGIEVSPSVEQMAGALEAISSAGVQ